MNIVILGAGRTGSYLAKTLSLEGHNITLIDIDAKALEKVKRTSDVATHLGSGTDPFLLEEVFEERPDLFVALSASDETNLAACLIAKNLQVEKTCARIQKTCFLSKSKIDIQRVFGVDYLIGTSTLVAHDILKAILHPGNLFVETFANGAAQMRTIAIPSNWPYEGKKLQDIRFYHNILIALIRRKGENGRQSILFPKGSDTIQEGDEVTLIGEISEMLQLPKFFGQTQKEVRSVILVGGTQVAFELIKLLLHLKIAVKLIDKDETVCKKFAEEFPHATIIHQDGSDFSFLLSEQIASSDVFVSCCNTHETNILCAYLAKKAECQEVIALISDTTYIQLLQELKITYVMAEKINISNHIHAILDEKNLLSLSSLYDNAAKILEIKVSSQSELIGIPLHELRKHLPEDFLIGIIENRGRIIIPKGSNIISAGDSVVVIATPQHAKQIKALF